MKKMFTILMGFIHDFATGCWLAAILATYWLDRHPASQPLAGVMSGLKKEFFYFGIFFALVVLATGAGRTLTYVSNVYGEDSERLRRKMLIVKHIVLLAIFGLGAYWQYTMVFK